MYTKGHGIQLHCWWVDGRSKWLFVKLISQVIMIFFCSQFPQASGVTEELSCLVFPWYATSTSQLPERVKIETISSSEKRLTDHVPKEGSPGLFGWNTVPKQANKVSLDNNVYPHMHLGMHVHLGIVLTSCCIISLQHQIYCTDKQSELLKIKIHIRYSAISVYETSSCVMHQMEGL